MQIKIEVVPKASVSSEPGVVLRNSGSLGVP
jgi:hypothetical protein